MGSLKLGNRFNMKDNLLPIYDQSKKVVGEAKIPQDFFGIEKPDFLLHKAVVTELANKRSAHRFFKNRSLVSGGGTKPWKQKGTGRARQGSIRSPQWVGGGDPFGGKHVDYSRGMNKKERRRALRAALQVLAEKKQIFVMSELHFEKQKTKLAREFFDRLGVDRAVLVLEKNDTTQRAFRNLRDVVISTVSGLQVFDLLKHENLILTKKVWDELVERLVSVNAS